MTVGFYSGLVQLEVALSHERKKVVHLMIDCFAFMR